jgi:hypothetical protein
LDKKPLMMPKPIPDSEDDRVAEAMILLAKISHLDMPLLTTWELEMIDAIRDGKAVTRIRLKELREAVERIEKQRAEKRTK